MARKHCCKGEKLIRAQEFARMLAHGARRSDCVTYGEAEWGVSPHACDNYLRLAREMLRADFDIERPQMVADLLAKYATIEQEARQRGHLHVALGAVNAQARLAHLVS